jgi:hypothetical protein
MVRNMIHGSPGSTCWQVQWLCYEISMQRNSSSQCLNVKTKVFNRLATGTNNNTNKMRLERLLYEQHNYGESRIAL